MCRCENCDTHNNDKNKHHFSLVVTYILQSSVPQNVNFIKAKAIFVLKIKP